MQCPLHTHTRTRTHTHTCTHIHVHARTHTDRLNPLRTGAASIPVCVAGFSAAPVLRTWKNEEWMRMSSCPGKNTRLGVGGQPHSSFAPLGREGWL